MVTLETESWEVVDRLPRSFAALSYAIVSEIRMLAEHVNSHCMRYVDPYGITVFNRMQMKQLRGELAEIRQWLLTDEARAVLDQIDAMAQRCEREVHLYLKFTGD